MTMKKHHYLVIIMRNINKIQYKIQGAGHLMIFDRADEINIVLKSLLENKRFPQGL